MKDGMNSGVSNAVSNGVNDGAKPSTHYRCLVGALLWGLLAVPPVRHLLESTMLLQMLAQLPLLAFAGWMLAQCTPLRLAQFLASWNRRGISGLLLASIVGMVWMLPRATDASLVDPLITLAKFLSVPLLIGAPVALSWPEAGFVVRGVVLSEVIATALRLGWLFLISPVRLCSNYLLDDQQQLGKSLLLIGFAILLVLVWRLMWGRMEIGRMGRASVQ